MLRAYFSFLEESMEQINEAIARAAKDANSFSDYIEGGATALCASATR